MKLHIILIFITINLCFTLGCKKEVSIPVQEITCDLDSTTHPDHLKYQEILDKYTTSGIVGLSVVVSKPGEATWHGASGYASIEDNVKMNPCHLHHTASLVKSYTATIILQLIEEGQLSFDTKVAQYFDDEIKQYIPNNAELTIKHLLQHTSGIPDIFNVEFFTALMNNPEKVYSTKELLAFNEDKEALYPAGSDYTYADPNFMLLAMIIDVIDGNLFESYKTRIFEPLNLQNIHYHDTAFPFNTGVVPGYWEQYEDGLVENISDIQNRLVTDIIGSDGIIASPKDMTNFYQSIFEGNLLNENTLSTIKTGYVNEVDTDRMDGKYSHGFMLLELDDEQWIGHPGSQIGASCYVFHNLDTGATIGVFTNTGTFLSISKKELVYSDLWNELRAAIE